MRWPPLPAFAVAAVVVLLAAGCSGSESRSSSTTSSRSVSKASEAASSTIVLAGDSLWVASPDDRSISVVSPEDGSTVRRIDLDGVPERLLALDNQVLVSYRDRSYVSVVPNGAASEALASRIDVPCSASVGLTTWWTADRRYAAVACPIDDRIAVIDLYQRRTRGWLQDAEPTEVVATDGSLASASSAGGTSSRSLDGIDRAAVAASPSGPAEALDVRLSGSAVWSPRGRLMSQVKALVASPEGPVAAYQVIDSERAADPTDPADTGSYASVIKGMARIEPAVSSWCPHLFSDFSSSSGSLSGPAALAVDRANSRLWVVGQFTGNVLVLDCAASARRVDGVDRAVVLASFSVGVGARGIVLSQDGSTAWVDSAFDHAVARLSFSSGAVSSRVRSLGAVSLSDAGQAGRRQFHDATDPHLTPNRTVTCASCHTDAGDDGQTWRISTREIPTKYRRTPPLWALTPSSLHWDGGVTSFDTLALDTIHQLLGGDGLLVDTSAMAAYLAETPVPPGAWVDPVSSHDAIAEGRALFEGAAGCASCHTGPSGSDGLRHDVVAPSTDPDGELAQVRTPRLVGLAGRSFFLHDGSAASLEDVLVPQEGDEHGAVAGLTESEREALVAYLRSL